MAGGQRSQKRSRGALVGRDQYVIKGKISGGAIAQGPNAKVQQTVGVDAAQLSALFDKIYQHIEARPEDPNVDKEELTSVVKNVEKEVAKGERANQTKLARWMDNLAKMAPDILDVALASLGGPVTGFTMVFKKIAERARATAAV